MTQEIVDVYNLTYDENFAPHHDGEVMSLACCMVRMRKTVGELWFSMENPAANLNYWIVGRVSGTLCTREKRHKKNWLIYFMRVTDVMSFDRYNREFPGRKDELYQYKAVCQCEDDNCKHRLDYHNYHQHTKVFDHHASHDIGEGKYVLISDDYCYYDWRDERKGPVDLEGWDIPELKWIAKGKAGPFLRKCDFTNTEEIIKRLQTMKRKDCEQYIWNLERNETCLPNDCCKQRTKSFSERRMRC